MRNERLLENLTKAIIVGFSALFPAWYIATKLVEAPAATVAVAEAPTPVAVALR